jgi:hypothetical protein
MIAPLNSHSDEWKNNKYVDAHTGKVYRLHDHSKEKRAGRIVHDDSQTPMPQLYGNVLVQSANDEIAPGTNRLGT